MNPEEQLEIQQQQREEELSQAQQRELYAQQTQQYLDVEEREKSIVKEQLDLSEELENIEHLLRGEVLRRDEIGNVTWIKPEDPDMVILSEYGIHLVLHTVAWYINKNTLLSNYDEDTINQKMEDMATDLTDTIFMEYEKVFQYPSVEDCKKILEERIEKKTEIRSFAFELLGKEIDKQQRKEIRGEFIEEIELRIDEEMEKIRQQLIKNKLKRFLLLIREVQDAVHSTYLRAYKGIERGTLRQHTQITETRGNMMQPPQTSRSLNPLKWGSSIK